MASDFNIFFSISINKKLHEIQLELILLTPENQDDFQKFRCLVVYFTVNILHSYISLIKDSTPDFRILSKFYLRRK